MARGSQTLTTYYAKRIIGDNAAGSSGNALLQIGEGVTEDTWILHKTDRDKLYGIKYLYDYDDTRDEGEEEGTQDKIELYGGRTEELNQEIINLPTAWIRLDTGDTYIFGKVGINDDPDETHYLYVHGITKLAGNVGIQADASASYSLYIEGKEYIYSGTSANSNILSSQLIISNVDDATSIQQDKNRIDNVSIELWRNKASSWQIINSNGDLYFRNNYIIVTQDNEDVLTANTEYSVPGLRLSQITGAGSIPYLTVGDSDTTTAYSLQVLGDLSYFSGTVIIANHDVTAINKSGSLILGSVNGTNLALDADEIMARTAEGTIENNITTYTSYTSTLNLNIDASTDASHLAKVIIGNDDDELAYLFVRYAQDASTISNGALRVEGGASIGKKLFVGTDLKVEGTSWLVDSTSIGDTKEIVAEGGTAHQLYVKGTTLITGITNITNETDCTAANTGAFQVSGGAYVAKQIRTSENMTIYTQFNRANTGDLTADAGRYLNFVSADNKNFARLGAIKYVEAKTNIPINSNRVTLQVYSSNSESTLKTFNLTVPPHDADNKNAFISWSDSRVGNSIFPYVNNTYYLGASSLRWITGYYTTSIIIGGTNYTGTASQKTGTTITPGAIDLSDVSPAINFHWNRTTTNYDPQIINDAKGRIHIQATSTIADMAKYNNRTINPILQASGSIYSSIAMETSGYYMNNIASTGDSGYYIKENNVQYGRLYIDTIATAQGYAHLLLGNDTSAGTAHNATGRILLYGTGAKYAQIEPGALTSDITLGAEADTFTMPKLHITSTQDVGGTTDLSGSTRPPLVIGGFDGQHLEIDRNEIAAKSNKAAVYTLNINIDGGSVVLNDTGTSYYTQIRSTQEATATDDGALRVNGGVGIEKQLYVGDIVRFTSGTISNATNAGALVVTGGVGIGKQLYVGGDVRFTAGTSSSGTGSGTLVVTGGMGVSGAIHAGTSITIHTPFNRANINDITANSSRSLIFTSKDSKTFATFTAYKYHAASGDNIPANSNRVYMGVYNSNTTDTAKTFSLIAPPNDATNKTAFITWSDSRVGNSILPYINNTYYLGSTALGWRGLYLRGTTAESHVLDTTGPFIEFSNSGHSEFGQLIYTDDNDEGGHMSLAFIGNSTYTNTRIKAGSFSTNVKEKRAYNDVYAGIILYQDGTMHLSEGVSTTSTPNRGGLISFHFNGSTSTTSYLSGVDGAVRANTKLVVNTDTYAQTLAGRTTTSNFTFVVSGSAFISNALYTNTGVYCYRSAKNGGFRLYQGSGTDTESPYGFLTIATIGSTSTTGKAVLSLGNNIASGTDKNAYGQIEIYQTNTNACYYDSTSWSGNGSQASYTFTGATSTTAGTAAWTTVILGNANDEASTNAHTRGNLRIYGAGTNYTDIRSNPNGNRVFYLPDYNNDMYAVHIGTAAVGSATKGVYVTATGRVTAMTVSINEGGSANTLAYYSGKGAISSGSITTNGTYLGNVGYITINAAHQTTYRFLVNAASVVSQDGGIYNKSTVFDLKTATNGYNSSGTMSRQFAVIDKNGDSFARINGGVTNSTDNGYETFVQLQVRSRNAAGDTLNSYRGITLYMNKAGTLRYNVYNASGFWSAISSSAIGTTASKAMAGNTVVNKVNQSASTSSSWRKVLLSGSTYTKFDTDVNAAEDAVAYASKTVSVIPGSGHLKATKVFNAVWNDYAECRMVETEEPGYCVTETNTGIMIKTSKRLEAGCKITSDTYGTCMGETVHAKTPVAVTGRVLVYPYRDRSEYPLGAAVCSAPNGTVDIMTRDEIMMYPERIVGTVSEIPTYEVWSGGDQDGIDDIKVNGRIWVYVR